MSPEQPIYGFEQDSWQIDATDPRIIALSSYVNTEGKVTTHQLSDFSPEALAGLTLLESEAFQSPMGESLAAAYHSGKKYTVFLTGKDNIPEGFLTFDESLGQEGLFYLDIAAVVGKGKGVGKNLLHEALMYVRAKSPVEHPVILARTRNPGAVMALAKAAQELGLESFPVDRRPNLIEQHAIAHLEEQGIMRKLSDRQVLDAERGLLLYAYENWKVEEFTPQSGQFADFLEREGIDYQQFCEDGNALIIGVAV